MDWRYEGKAASISLPTDSFTAVARQYDAIDLELIEQSSQALFLFYLKDPYAAPLRRMLATEQFRDASVKDTFRKICSVPHLFVPKTEVEGRPTGDIQGEGVRIPMWDLLEPKAGGSLASAFVKVVSQRALYYLISRYSAAKTWSPDAIIAIIMPGSTLPSNWAFTL